MEITSIRNGYLIFKGPARSYCLILPNGHASCHWSFFPRLYHDCQGDVQISGEDKVKLRALSASRRVLLAVKSQVPDDDRFTRLFHPDRQPYEYQVSGMWFALHGMHALIGDDVGLGKTIQSIGLILHAFEAGDAKRVLVVTETSATYQWRQEFLWFANPELFPDLNRTIQIVEGKPKERLRQYVVNRSIWITTYKTLLRDKEKIADWAGKLDMVFLDEASAIKNPESKTAQMVKRLFGRMKYRVPLTATGIENKLHDLYSIVDWVDPTVFPGLRWFENEYCRIAQFYIRKGGRRVLVRKVEGYKNLADARARVEHAYIRRTNAEVKQQLPEIVPLLVNIELTDQQKKVYQRLGGEIQGLPSTGQGARAGLMGALTHLRMVCNDSGLVEGPPSSAKLEELKRYLAELADHEKIVIFSEFKTFTDRVVAALTEYRPHYIHGGVSAQQREIQRRAFQEGEGRVMVATAAGERAINLQAACVLINLELPYNPARLRQRIGRICRLGSKHTHVRVINMVARGTFEANILKILEKKGRLFDTIFEADGIDRIGEAVASLSMDDLKQLV